MGLIILQESKICGLASSTSHDARPQWSGEGLAEPCWARSIQGSHLQYACLQDSSSVQGLTPLSITCGSCWWKCPSSWVWRCLGDDLGVPLGGPFQAICPGRWPMPWRSLEWPGFVGARRAPTTAWGWGWTPQQLRSLPFRGYSQSANLPWFCELMGKDFMLLAHRIRVVHYPQNKKCSVTASCKSPQVGLSQL